MPIWSRPCRCIAGACSSAVTTRRPSWHRRWHARPARRCCPTSSSGVRATASQQGLGGRARIENVTAGAFRLHPWHRRRVEEGDVLLVDDVLTTGATVEACARVLHRAGAAEVDVPTLAKVVRDGSHPI